MKLLTLSTADKIRDLQKYATPGGFDFYKPSRDAVRAYCSGGLSREEVERQIVSASTQNSLATNKGIFGKVVEWLDKQSGSYDQPNIYSWTSPNKVFSVIVEPEIKIISSDVRFIAVYPKLDVKLTRDQAGAGILLMRQTGKFAENEKLGVLDAYRTKAFWTPTNVSAGLLTHEVQVIENELNTIL
jgi:hypothetical protein